jgi:hypothetical protein
MLENPYKIAHAEFIPVPALMNVYSLEFSMTAFNNSNIEAFHLAEEIKYHLKDKGFEVICCELAKDFGFLSLEIKDHVVDIEYLTKDNNEECMLVHIKYQSKEIQVKETIRNTALQELKDLMQNSQY